MKIYKTIAVLLSIWFSILMVAKWVLAKVWYLASYPLKDWTYGDDVIKNYHIPKGVQKNPIKKFFWLALDDDQITGYSLGYAKSILGRLPETRWEKFYCAYRWSAIRNPMYNINYVYFGNQSDIVHYIKSFGKYEWDRKLRSSNGDNGVQLVWFLTEKNQSRFIFSLAKSFTFIRAKTYTTKKWFLGLTIIPTSFELYKQPITAYYGWNPNFNGRFTVAGKFK